MNIFTPNLESRPIVGIFSDACHTYSYSSHIITEREAERRTERERERETGEDIEERELVK